MSFLNIYKNASFEKDSCQKYWAEEGRKLEKKKIIPQRLKNKITHETHR